MNVYNVKKEQKELIETFVNYELVELAPDYMTPKLVFLFFKLKNPCDDFQTFFQTDPTVTNLITNDGVGYFAGARLAEDWLELYYYTSNSKLLRHILQEKLPQGTQHEIGSKNDDEWKFFFDKLNPSKSELRQINNRFVVDDLLEAGDDLDALHTYEHTFYAHTASQREKVKNELLSIGHSVIEEFMDDTIDQRFGLTTAHQENAHLDSINNFSKNVTEIAFKYHTHYEGWVTDLAHKDNNAQ